MKKILMQSTLLFMGSALLTTMIACSTNRGSLSSSSANEARDLKPAGPRPAWAPSITDNMLVVIEKLQSYGVPPIETLTAEQARQQPTPADAVRDVMKDAGMTIPAVEVTKQNSSISVNGASLPVRIYTPRDNRESYPVIVYYHGGGWVIANLDTYDASAQALSEQTGAMVVSVHYRQGPEHKFPTAHNDAYAAYEWVVNNAASMKGDANHIAVAGESAGGNLACNVSIMARDKGFRMPVAQLLVYPIADNNMNNDSYTAYADAKPLNKAMMMWFAQNYLNDMSEAADPRISLVNANLSGLPPTIVITAEIDPLHDEGKLLAGRLKDAGVNTDYEDFKGVTHEFFGMASVVPKAREAQREATGFLVKRLR